MVSNHTHTAKVYDKHADQYHEYRKQGNSLNALLDAPTVISFLKDIKGKRVIDVGCGSGIYSKMLKKRGADVYGIDISKNLIKIAKEEVAGVDFFVGSIEQISFPKNIFDIAVCTIVLNYLKDWDTAFREICRVLKPGGEFVFSIPNPIVECKEKVVIGKDRYSLIGYCKKKKRVFGDYFKERSITAEFIKGVKFKNYHKTYETVIDTILRNNFSIEGYKDEKPLPESKKVYPEEYALLSKMPRFCVFKVRKR